MLALLAAALLSQAPDAGLVDAGLVDAGVMTPLPSALARVVAEATAILEVELPLITTEQPLVRWRRALRQPKGATVLVARGPVEAPAQVDLPQWEPLRSCLFLTNDRLSVRALVVLQGDQLKPLPLATFGLGLESTPGYEALKAALREAFTWAGARYGPEAAPAARWPTQRAALVSDNAVLRHLAAEFLVQQGAAEVLAEVWGPPGTPQRLEAEARARVAPDCKPRR